MRFQHGTVTTQQILESLSLNGAAIIEGVLDPHKLAELNQQARQQLHLAAQQTPNEFMGSLTKRVGSLMASMPAARELAQHPLVTGVLDQTLTKYCPTYQLHFSGIMHVMQGERKQIPHRDATPFLNPSPVVVMATMWALTDFKAENGATVFVPGSHLWHDDRIPTPEESQIAEMPAGSVLIWAGNLIHGAGSCSVGYRTGLSLQYSVGWLRQEENQYMAVPRELAATFPESLQKLLGYDLASRHWGYVGQQHPHNHLMGVKEPGRLDPDGYDPEKCQGLRVVAEEPFRGQLYPERYGS